MQSLSELQRCRPRRDTVDLKYSWDVRGVILSLPGLNGLTLEPMTRWTVLQYPNQLHLILKSYDGGRGGRTKFSQLETDMGHWLLYQVLRTQI